MSNKTIKIPVVDEKSIITIKVSGHYLKMVQLTLMQLGQGYAPEKFTEILNKLKEEKPAEDIQELLIHLLTTFVMTCEMAAKEQNLIVERDIEIPATGS